MNRLAVNPNINGVKHRTDSRGSVRISLYHKNRKNQ